MNYKKFFSIVLLIPCAFCVFHPSETQGIMSVKSMAEVLQQKMFPTSSNGKPAVPLKDKSGSSLEQGNTKITDLEGNLNKGRGRPPPVPAKPKKPLKDINPQEKGEEGNNWPIVLKSNQEANKQHNRKSISGGDHAHHKTDYSPRKSRRTLKGLMGKHRNDDKVVLKMIRSCNGIIHLTSCLTQKQGELGVNKQNSKKKLQAQDLAEAFSQVRQAGLKLNECQKMLGEVDSSESARECLLRLDRSKQQLDNFKNFLTALCHQKVCDLENSKSFKKHIKTSKIDAKSVKTKKTLQSFAAPSSPKSPKVASVSATGVFTFKHPDDLDGRQIIAQRPEDDDTASVFSWDTDWSDSQSGDQASNKFEDDYHVDTNLQNVCILVQPFTGNTQESNNHHGNVTQGSKRIALLPPRRI